jgi:hypothetical protein
MPKGLERVRVWIADGQRNTPTYVAVFNLDDKPIEIHHGLADLSSALANLKLVNVWDKAAPAQTGALELTLAPHACALFKVAGK